MLVYFYVYVTFAASKLGIPSPPAYLSVAQNVDDLLKGVNYASGGAGILNDTGLYFVSITFSTIQTIVVTCLTYGLNIFQIQKLSFDDQINSFKKTKDAIITKLGEAAATKHFNEAMYFVGIGNTCSVQKVLLF